MHNIKVGKQLTLSSVDREVKQWNGVGKKPLAIVSGKISEADIVNANGFIIPLQEWHDMLNSDVNQERLRLGKMYCTVGHDERPVEDYDVRRGEISHIITDMWIEGKDVFMTANVCDTQSGQDLMGVIGAGGYIQASTRLGISPRKDENTGAECLVGKDSVIFGVDLVLDPAIESTYVNFQNASKVENNTKTSSKIIVNCSNAKEVNKRLELTIASVEEEIKKEKEAQEFYRGLLK